MNDLSNLLNKMISSYDANKDTLADNVADASVNFFLSEFDNTKWEDVEWTPLAESTKKYKSKKYNSTTPLVNTGDLREALKDSKVSASLNTGIEFEVDSEYSSYHNDGDGVAQRQFIGESYELDNIIESVVEDELNKIFK